MGIPLLNSKHDRVPSVIPKLYLRPSADVSGRIAWSGQPNLLGNQHSTLLVQATFRPTRWKVDAASKARRSASHHDHFPGAFDSGVRRVPSKAASYRVGQSTNANGWTG